ncbi:TerC family protein [Pseudactinotalea sp. Z1748]|uniref:TerC family protein n=1 Tax=Pseudactinotalea sp. Z1748 TaxID=3413027 RepID=UPI003C7A8AA7
MSGSQVLAIFGVVVIVLLAIDLFVVHRRETTVTVRSAAIWSVVWIGAAVVFGFAVFPFYGDDGSVGDYFGVFVVEKSLSVDNVFLWLVVFASLGVPKNAQRRVLLFGVLGALVLRFGVVNAGVVIMESFTWVLWVAGAFLLYAGYKMWRERHEPVGGHHAGGAEAEQTDSALTRLIRRVLPTTEGFRGDRFVVREDGRLRATPLLLALILVELSDIVMALDALPATLAISTDVVVVMCATGFALLGLRALFFLLSGIAERLRYLKIAVALILVYIGATLIIENVVEAYHASTAQSLAVIGVVLAAAVLASVRAQRAEDRSTGADDDGGPADDGVLTTRRS